MGFTDEQIQVINSRDKNLIVSAAAGSGKTAVLTERIVRRIVERKTSIDRMLIVTFTNASAREMRDRIGKRLREELAKDPGDSNIRKQIAILHTAQITTIDSFCLFILKNHFEEIGIDPAFSIGNEGELKELQDEAFDDALEQAFKEAKPSFLNLVEMYAPKGKYGTFKDIVIKLATTVDSTPFPFDTLEKCIVKDIEDVWDLGFVHFIEDYENEFLMEALNEYYYVKDLTEGSALSKHYDEACAEISFVNSLLENGFEFRSRAFLSHEKIKLLYGGKKFNEEETEIKQDADEYIKHAGKILDDLKKEFHYITPEQFEELTKGGYLVTNALIEFVISYMKLFDSKKRDKCVISFSDMEHMALDILVENNNGILSPTQTALTYRDYYDEVMIDEYQDSNDVQETILSIISKDEETTGNRFMVGDIKQSIYGFRHAKPEIFKEKCERYEKDDTGKNERINLTRNFRSRKEVIDAVNFVFERCMKDNVGGISYDKNERLYLGLEDYPISPSDNKAELLYVDDKEFQEDPNYQSFDKDDIEPIMVAKRIRELVDQNTKVYDKKTNSMRDMKYSDIAILMRSMSGNRDVLFQKALKDEGIPAYVISKTGYYSATEVQLILNFLSIVDNPRQDLPLLNVMHSFIGGFSEEEIARIRKYGKKKRLIDSMYLYIIEGDDESIKDRINHFTEDIDELRKHSMYMSASEMLREIYDKYEYTAMVSSLPGGEQRLANVKFLLETADEFENQGIYCIHDFVKYIEKLKARQDMGEANMLDENADVVRIMTIHKSKGLEFPICFVSSMHTKFRSATDDILYDEEFGIGSETFNLEKRTKSSSPVWNAIHVKEYIEALGEEIRILYVAMTRAREKLIMTGRLYKNVDSREELSFVNMLNAESFMELVYPLIKENSELFTIKKYEPSDFETSGIVNEVERESQRKELENIEAKSDFNEFTYPHSSLDSLFVKTTVSELKKEAYLEKEEGENTLYHETEKKIPKIISEAASENEGAKRGSAYHRVMELMDFVNIYDGDILNNLRTHRKKMVDNLYIYEEDDALVSEKKIVDFLNTDLCKRMSEASKIGKLYLEQPFVLSVNAHEVRDEFPDDERVLVQGVIDVYFEENGKLVLMDYKTDKVDSADELIKRYKTQLDYYSEALSRLEKKEVAEIYIYSFSLEEVIRVI